MATQALEDALNIIEILRQEYTAGVSELSKKLKLNKNKVFRIIATLELKGIVELDKETGKYRLGMNLIKLEHAYIKSLYFLDKAKQSIRALRQEINENIYLAILHRKDVIYVYEEPVRKSVIVESPLAKRFKADKTATGRVLKRARKEVGFIVEYEIGSEINEVATIVRDEFYYPIASLSVIAPSVRMPLEKIEKDIQHKLVETAEEITEILAPTFSLD
ncbi:helix-turn-helix domain-containing protein [Persephonella atlantica]|uniref:Helix-turn-helix domain-containing protein n=1 Tax=Persephonella atlantica TaxID=2699429 RepID=A0ABS1GI10_9AQUI|nr:helix-turn-helix domain-containing protein [Persephonella atlantica]MBK3332573.1 helix-turn-helix domain-containing protein [Persephonella atlantica]